MPNRQINHLTNHLQLTTTTSDVFVPGIRHVIVFTLNRIALRRNLRLVPRPQTEVTQGAGSHLKLNGSHHPIHRERIALADRSDLREMWLEELL
jgi:hypothetical protein